MPKVYLKCVRIGTDEWESDRDGECVIVHLDGYDAAIVRVGGIIAVEGDTLKSLFASLPADKQQAVLEYDGPEDFGHPEWQNKR